MKKIASRFSILFVLLAVSFGSVAMAQPRGGRGGYGYSHSGGSRGGYHDDGFIRGMRNVETVAHGAMMAYALGSLDDYTGIRIGCNAASLRTSGFSGSDLNSSYKPGLDLGIVFGWYLGGSPVIIEPGIYYSQKGGKLQGYDGYEALYKYSTNTTMHMLEIPLVFKYEVQFHNAGVCLHPFMGGFLSFGCGGKTKDSSSEMNYNTFGSGGLKYTDAGLRMGCGMGIDHLFLEIAYDLGLVNLAQYDYDYFHYNDYSDAIHSNTISFNIGVNF